MRNGLCGSTPATSPVTCKASQPPLAARLLVRASFQVAHCTPGNNLVEKSELMGSKAGRLPRKAALMIGQQEWKEPIIQYIRCLTRERAPEESGWITWEKYPKYARENHESEEPFLAARLCNQWTLHLARRQYRATPCHAACSHRVAPLLVAESPGLRRD